MRILAAGILGLTLTTPQLWAQCATSVRPDARETIDRIQLIPIGFPSSLGSVVSNGMGMWNHSGCNQGTDDFPYFQFESPGAGRTIHVNYVSGVNPDNPIGCGNFEGNEISIFTHFRPNGTGPLTSCGTADVLADNVAHELGHVLGLDNQFASSCNGYIMSQVVRRRDGSIIDRSVRPEECAKANEINIVQAELPPPPEENNIYCDAYCWTSCVNNQCPERPDLGCPVLLDIEEDGFHLTGLDGGVWFDIDADGTLDFMSWTDGGDGFLAFDRNGNETIDDGSELFGNYTPLASGIKAPNGYVALAEFDLPDSGGNGDGQIDSRDRIFPDLWIWTDSNHNGVSEPEEISTLTEQGVVRIGLAYRHSHRTDAHGNEFRFVGRAWKLNRNGVPRPRLTWDVFFLVVP